jgi:hypothetical protein
VHYSRDFGDLWHVGGFADLGYQEEFEKLEKEELDNAGVDGGILELKDGKEVR